MARYSSQFPDPVVLVTVATPQKRNVMTVGWASPVSFDPPILMVSIAPARVTHDLILEAGEFGVSILGEGQKELSTLAGTLHGDSHDKLGMPQFTTIQGERLAVPLIAGARACFECRLVEHHSIGDHTVFYGEVLRMTVDESVSPLVLFNGVYYALGEERGRYP
ncbi:flavin reductase family protein [Candidatus Fermentibacteria bacterium]|nr:flavin reductase family protein [Candidatus Fermentibacteria bacterium]